MKMDELFMNVGNIFLVNIEQKKQGAKHLCWFILKFLTHEMLKSYFKSYFVLLQYEVY
jgi:hypothetical protein